VPPAATDDEQSADSTPMAFVTSADFNARNKTCRAREVNARAGRVL